MSRVSEEDRDAGAGFGELLAGLEVPGTNGGDNLLGPRPSPGNDYAPLRRPPSRADRRWELTAEAVGCVGADR